MIKNFIFCTFLLFSFFSTLSGQDQELVFESPSSSSREFFLDPLNLEENFWNSFVGLEDLDREIQSFEARSREQLPLLETGGKAEELSSLLDQILKNIQNWKKLYQTKQVPRKLFSLSEGSFSLSQLEELFFSLQENETTLKDKQENLSEIREALDRGWEQFESVFRRYGAVEFGGELRWELGLRLIAQRSVLAVLEEQERFLSGEVEWRLENIRALESAQRRAREDLSFEEEGYLNSLAEWKTAKEELQKKLEEGNQQEQTVYQMSSAEEGQAQVRLDSQKKLLQRLERTRLEQRVFVAESRVLVGRVLQGGSEEWLREVQGRLLKLREAFQQMEEDLARWKGRVSRDKERLAQAMISRDIPSGELVFLETRAEMIRNTEEILQILEVRLEKWAFLQGILEEQIILQSPVFMQFLSRIWYTLREIFLSFYEIATVSLFRLGETSITLSDVMEAIALFFVAVLISRIVRGGLQRIGKSRGSLNTATLYNLDRLSHYTILFVGTLVALMALGVNFNRLLILAGALSVGIGFGLQNIANNFLSGLILLFDGSVKIGDFLELSSGFRGRVVQINVRRTVIRTNDGLDVIVPNAEIASNRVINWTMQDLHRRIRVPFGVAYGTDKELVKKAVLEAAERVPWTLKDAGESRTPQVWLVRFGDSALEFELVVWLNAYASKRYRSTEASYLWEIESSLKQYGIEIPFPQRVVHLQRDKEDKKDLKKEL